MTVENGQPVESTETVKDICAHCLTVCSQLPRIDFICAKCGQLTLSMETDHSDWPQFTKIFSKDPKFQEFYVSLLKAGAEEGKRYCLHCLNGLWQRYLANPDVLKRELDAPKHDFSLKKKHT
jgi:hypothetical protein